MQDDQKDKMVNITLDLSTHEGRRQFLSVCYLGLKQVGDILGNNPSENEGAIAMLGPVCAYLLHTYNNIYKIIEKDNRDPKLIFEDMKDTLQKNVTTLPDMD